MALVGALSSLRASVLRHISVPTQSAAAQQSLGAACSLIFRRGFAEGTYLDKNQVTDRVLEVTKNFGSKVDTGKVSPSVSFKELGLDSLDTVEVVMAYEEEFGIEIPDSEADKIQSTADAIAFIASHPQAK